MLGISVGISMILAAAQYTSTNPTENEKYAVASRAAAEATYISSGIQKDVENLEKEYIPEKMRLWAGHMMVFSRLVGEHRVEMRWEW